MRLVQSTAGHPHAARRCTVQCRPKMPVGQPLCDSRRLLLLLASVSTSTASTTSTSPTSLPLPSLLRIPFSLSTSLPITIFLKHSFESPAFPPRTRHRHASPPHSPSIHPTFFSSQGQGQGLCFTSIITLARNSVRHPPGSCCLSLYHHYLSDLCAFSLYVSVPAHRLADICFSSLPILIITQVIWCTSALASQSA